MATTPRSAAQVRLWHEHRLLDGAVVAIGNAPTTLYALLQAIRDEGAAPPAAILAFPVGFVGAAESKQALATLGLGVAVPDPARPARRQRHGGGRGQCHRRRAADVSDAPWLSVVGIGEEGLPRPGAGGARAGRPRPRFWSAGDRHLAMLPPDARERLVWPSPLSALIGAIAERRGAAGLRPGDRRSDAFRRRRDPGAAVRARRDDDRARRFRLLAGGGAARLAAGGGGVPDPARPAAGTDPAGAPTRPPDPGAEPRRRDAGRCGGGCCAGMAGGRAAWWRSPIWTGRRRFGSRRRRRDGRPMPCPTSIPWPSNFRRWRKPDRCRSCPAC